MDYLVKKCRDIKKNKTSIRMLRRYDNMNKEILEMQLDCDIVVSNVKIINGVKNILIDGKYEPCVYN